MLFTELNYELRIRDKVTEKCQDDESKILGRLLAKEKQRGIDPRAIRIKLLDLATEKFETENTLASIKNLIRDFDGPTTESCFQRRIILFSEFREF